MKEQINKVFGYIKKKQFYFALIICLISLITLSVVILNPGKKDEPDIADLNDTIEASTEDGLSENLVDNNSDMTNEDDQQPITIASEDVEGDESAVPAEGDSGDGEATADGTNEENNDGQQPDEQPTGEEANNEAGSKGQDTVEVSSHATQQANLNFADSDKMIWPTSGSILLPYSMDTPIYFKTLDQYKINPAVFISGDVGSDIKAAADGIVEKIETSAQLGNSIVLFHGNGWKTVYGQLNSKLNVKEGDLVKRGQVIATINEPSKYYVMLDPHLYFKVEKHDMPMDPSAVIE